MKKSKASRRNDLKSNKIPKAVTNIIDSLYKIGYISIAERNELEYRVKTGDITVYKEVRDLLLDIVIDLNEITK